MVGTALGVIAAASAEGPIALFDAKTGQLRVICRGMASALPASPGPPMANFSRPAGRTAKSVCGADIPVCQNPKRAPADRNVCPTNQIKDMPAGAAWVERLAWPPNADLSPPPPARNCGSGTRLANCSANVPIIRPPSPTSPGSPASRSSLRPHTASCFSGVRSKPPPSAISPGKDRCSHLRGAPTANTSRPGRRIAASTFGF